MTFCLLPLDILGLILASLKNNSDLDACALVSSALLPVARSLRFRHVFLLPKPRQLSPYPPNACLQLLSLLSMSPTLAHHIKRLSIIDGRLFPSNDIVDSQTGQMDPLLSALGAYNPLSQQYHTTRDKLNGPRWFLNTPPDTLHALFFKLRQAGLRDVDLVFPDGPKVSWNAIPPDTRDVLRFLFNSPRLERIEIRGACWDSRTDLRDLTDVISIGGAKSLAFRGVRVPDFATQIPNRGRPATRQDPSLKITCTPSHHAKTFHTREFNPKTQPSSINSTAYPLISLSSHAYSRMLDLESLCVSSAHGSAGPQAPETLGLLRALFLDPDLDSAKPLVNALRLEKLEIPSVELDYLPGAVDLLRQSGTVHGLESLTLSNRLNTSQVCLNEIITNFSDFSNLKHLRLGIYIPHTTTHHSSSAEPPNTLLWLNQTLSTLPPTLSHLELSLAIDTRSFYHFRGGITTDYKDEWCALAERLRLVREKVRADVSLDLDTDRGRIERGRGRELGWGVAPIGAMDVKLVRKYLDGLFAA